MNYKPREYRISDIIKDIEKPNGRAGKLYMDFANQRAFVWSREQQSLYIHSILQGDLIPEIYILKNGVAGLQPKTILDGRQRTTTTYLYYTNTFKLHKNTPDVEIDIAERDENGNIIYNENGEINVVKKVYQIAGKKFKQLPKELQEVFLDFDITTREMFDCTEADIARQMHKLNNGKAMTAAQRAITRLGITLGTEIKKISENDFFEERIMYTASQIKTSEGMRCVLQSLILYTGKNYSKLGNADLTHLAEDFANDWSQADLDQLNNLFLMLNMLLPNNDLVKKYLTVHNIPVLIINMDKYCSMLDDGDITEEQYKEFLKYWFSEGIHSNLYTQYEGKSISSKANIDGRIDTMEIALLKFLQGEKLPMELEYDKIFDVVEEAEVDIIGEPVNEFLKEEEKIRYFTTMLMVSSDKSIEYVDSNAIESFVKYFDNLSEDDQHDLLLSAQGYGEDLAILLEDAHISSDNEFVSSDNLVALSKAYEMTDSKDVNYETIIEWLDRFVKSYTNNVSYKSVYGVVDKIKYLQTDLFKYKKNKDLEKIQGGKVE